MTDTKPPLDWSMAKKGATLHYACGGSFVLPSDVRNE